MFCDICMPEAFCEFETVRKEGLLNLWVLWEKKSPTWEKGFPSVRGRNAMCRWDNLFVVISGTLTTCEKHLQNGRGGPLFTMEMLVRWKNITSTIPESYLREMRRCLSCIKKRLFLHQEGHVLGCWRAFPRTLKGVGRIGEVRKMFTRSERVRNEDSETHAVGKAGTAGRILWRR